MVYLDHVAYSIITCVSHAKCIIPCLRRVLYTYLLHKKSNVSVRSSSIALCSVSNFAYDDLHMHTRYTMSVVEPMHLQMS